MLSLLEMFKFISNIIYLWNMLHERRFYAYISIEVARYTFQVSSMKTNRKMISFWIPFIYRVSETAEGFV